MQKLSNIVRNLGKTYDKVDSKLYVKGRNGRCGVCALGGIALTVAPERFVPASDGVGLIDKTKSETHEDDISVNYSDILHVAGVSDKIITPEERYTYTDTRGTEFKCGSLYEFIWRMNDDGKSWEEIADALQKIGL